MIENIRLAYLSLPVKPTNLYVTQDTYLEIRNYLNEFNIPATLKGHKVIVNNELTVPFEWV